MAVQLIRDLTNDFNAAHSVNVDIGGWDYAILQLVSPSTTVNFLTSNDSGDVQSVSDGSAVSATNFVSVSGTKLSDGTLVTSLAASGLVRFGYIGRYLQFSGTAVTATKVLLRLFKIC